MIARYKPELLSAVALNSCFQGKVQLDYFQRNKQTWNAPLNTQSVIEMLCKRKELPGLMCECVFSYLVDDNH